jgi:hypothetical protein
LGLLRLRRPGVTSASAAQKDIFYAITPLQAGDFLPGSTRRWMATPADYLFGFPLKYTMFHKTVPMALMV